MAPTWAVPGLFKKISENTIRKKLNYQTMFIIYFEDLGSRLFWDPDMKFVHTASDEVIHF